MFKALFTVIRTFLGVSAPPTTNVTFNNCNFQIGMLGRQQQKKSLAPHTIPDLNAPPQYDCNGKNKGDKH